MGQNSMKDCWVTKNFKGIKSEGFLGDLESKKACRDNDSQNI